MGVVRKTISLTEEQDAWVKEQVASGEFTNESEFHRMAIRKVMEAENYKKAVLAKIRSGQASGYSDASFDEIIETGRERAKSELAKRVLSGN